MNLFYPNTCCFCGKVSVTSVCSQCEKAVEYVKEPVCKKCGKPIRCEENEYCSDCIETPKIFEQGKSIWVHTGCVRWSIYQFKYHNRRVYGEYYASEMYRLYKEKIKEWNIDVIVPVPLHWKRRLSRGYNQAEVLARALAKKTGIMMRTNLVKRKKNTRPQKKLSHGERSKNVKNAFCVTELESGMRNILIIDDIYTTGNTMNEMAKCLYSKGAQKVFFLTISIGQGC